MKQLLSNLLFRCNNVSKRYVSMWIVCYIKLATTLSRRVLLNSSNVVNLFQQQNSLRWKQTKFLTLWTSSISINWNDESTIKSLSFWRNSIDYALIVTTIWTLWRNIKTCTISSTSIETSWSIRTSNSMRFVKRWIFERTITRKRAINSRSNNTNTRLQFSQEESHYFAVHNSKSYFRFRWRKKRRWEQRDEFLQEKQATIQDTFRIIYVHRWNWFYLTCLKD